MSATPIAISPPHAYIDGAQAAPESGETFETMTPATGQVLAEIAACGPADIDRAVSSARRAFDGGEWSRRAPAEKPPPSTTRMNTVKLVSRSMGQST